MGAGKVLCIIGGIITLLATYLFAFAPFIPGVSFYGIGFIQNIPALFQSGEILAIIMAIVFIIFMVAGVFIILGVKVRALAIIGSIFAIGVSVYFILTWYVFGVLTEIGQFMIFFLNLDLFSGIIPLNIILGGLSLGTYLLLGGGVLGLIGGIMGPESF